MRSPISSFEASCGLKMSVAHCYHISMLELELKDRLPRCLSLLYTILKLPDAQAQSWEVLEGLGPRHFVNVLSFDGLLGPGRWSGPRRIGPLTSSEFEVETDARARLLPILASLCCDSAAPARKKNPGRNPVALWRR